MEAVQIDYELETPLDQMPALTPFETGTDLLHLLAITADLEQFRDAKARKVDWRVHSVSGTSAALRSISEPDVASRAALSLVRGFNEAEETEQLPRGWNLRVGQRAARVASRLGDDDNTGLRLSVHGPDDVRAHVTRRAGRHLKSATDLRITSYGSVVGVLGRVTAKGKQRTAALWSDLTGRRIDVRFGEQHVEEMRNAWAHSHVEVTGVLHENVSGQVLRVNLDSLRVLDRERVNLSEALPHGFYPEMTGGLGAREYLRLVRGEG